MWGCLMMRTTLAEPVNVPEYDGFLQVVDALAVPELDGKVRAGVGGPITRLGADRACVRLFSW